MASFKSKNTTLFFAIIIFFFLSSFNEGKFSEQYRETSTANNHNEKTTHLHFYLHDIISGKHPTAIDVAGRINTFGSTVIIDDPLTEGADLGSDVVGRAQGIYTMSSQDNAGLLMVMMLDFTAGEYNGSSLSVLGMNRFLEPVREMPIVGGSGRFRLARGYVRAKTERFSVKTGNAVVEYDVFVIDN